jgi:hypothetical protein
MDDRRTPPTSPTPSNGAVRDRRHRLVRAVAPLALGLALAATAPACGRDDPDEGANDAADQLAEQIAESGAGKEADVDIDSSSGQVDVSTDEGQMSFGEQTELPADFPAEVPLPERYELTSAMTDTAGGVGGWTVIGDLPDASGDTYDAVLSRFTDAGWTTTSSSSSDTGGGTVSTAMLEDGRWQVVVSVQVGVADTADSFSYLVTPMAG